MLTSLSGVHTALVTPFKDGQVDLDSYRDLCQRQIDAGVQGLVPCGTTGETATLTNEEWEACITTAVRVAAGKVPVTAGCGTNNTASTVANIQRARELGADAALVVLPYYNKPNPAGHLAHMRAACAAGLPVVVYHVPGRTAQRLGGELLAQLANLDGVIAVKEATGDIGFGSDLVAATERSVLSGDDFTFFPLMAVGGAGVISVVSNVAPATTAALAAAAARGDLATARDLHHKLMPLVHYLFDEVNPVPAKACMERLGLCTREVRLPLAPAAALPPAALLAGLE